MSSGNILIITNWGYEEGLIQSYTLPYLKIIHKVYPDAFIYLITQEKNGLQNNKEKLETIETDLKQYNIILLPETYHRAGLWKYTATGINFLRHLSFIFTHKIGYLHSFCTPAGSYAYLLARASGKKLIIDSYEPHAEYMLECGVWKEDGFPYKVLNALEKKQARRADYLIATTPTMVAHAQKKFSIKIKQSYVKPACVDLQKFSFDEDKAKVMRKALGFENKIVCVYAGKFGDFYLKEEVFEFYKVAFAYWGEYFHVLLLSNISAEELSAYCQQFELKRNQFTLIRAPHEMVPVYLSAADFGLSPYRPTPSKKFCTPIKNGEYWAIGLPVIITKDISVDSDIIDGQGIGYVLKELSEKEYLTAVKSIEKLLKSDRIKLREAIRNVAVNNRSFSIAEMIYKKIYN